MGIYMKKSNFLVNWLALKHSENVSLAIFAIRSPRLQFTRKQKYQLRFFLLIYLLKFNLWEKYKGNLNFFSSKYFLIEAEQIEC